MVHLLFDEPFLTGRNSPTEKRCQRPAQTIAEDVEAGSQRSTLLQQFHGFNPER